MCTVLEKYRQELGLSYAEFGRAAGFQRSTALRQVRGKVELSAGAALRYHLAFGIPLEKLRPDLAHLQPPTGDNPQPGREAEE